MGAAPVRSGLKLDGLRALSLLRAMGASPLLLIGAGLLVALGLPYGLETLGNPALDGPKAAGVAALWGGLTALALTRHLRRQAIEERLGPLAPALMDRGHSRRLGLARWAVVVGSVLILTLAVWAVARPEHIPIITPALFAGAVLGLGLGWALPVKHRDRTRRPLAPSSSMGLGGLLPLALGLGGLSALLHHQGLEDQAHLPRLAALAVLALSQIDSPSRLMALLASRPAPLISILGPLAFRPLGLVGLGAGLLMALTGTGLLASVVAGLGLAGLSALLRLLIALSRLGHSEAMARRLLGLELLIPLLIAVTGQWPLVPLWLVIRFIWLWRRAGRVRFREVTP